MIKSFIRSNNRYTVVKRVVMRDGDIWYSCRIVEKLKPGGKPVGDCELFSKSQITAAIA